MKFVTYRNGDEFRLGLLDEAKGILDLERAAAAIGRKLPDSMVAFIEAGEAALQTARLAADSARKFDNGHAWLPADTPLAAPIPHPRKNVFCVGRNYKLHIMEMARVRNIEVKYPKVPEFFTKPATTVIGHDDGVPRHAKHTDSLDYEVEIAVVIGKKVRDLSVDEALSAVFGYTIVNDVTARNAQRDHGQFFKGKAFDKSCPMGPCIVTADEYGNPAGHRLALTVNGQVRQDSSTSDLLFSVPEIISSLSQALTLEPGDVIATGTPSGVAQGMNPPGYLQVGDLVECEIEGIGRLRNRIVD